MINKNKHTFQSIMLQASPKADKVKSTEHGRAAHIFKIIDGGILDLNYMLFIYSVFYCTSCAIPITERVCCVGFVPSGLP